MRTAIGDYPVVLVFSANDEKVQRCIMDMEEGVFNEQLSLYGLHLESIRFVPNGAYSTRELTLSRTDQNVGTKKEPKLVRVKGDRALIIAPHSSKHNPLSNFIMLPLTSTTARTLRSHTTPTPIIK